MSDEPVYRAETPLWVSCLSEECQHTHSLTNSVMQSVFRTVVTVSLLLYTSLAHTQTNTHKNWQT